MKLTKNRSSVFLPIYRPVNWGNTKRIQFCERQARCTLVLVNLSVLVGKIDAAFISSLQVINIFERCILAERVPFCTSSSLSLCGIILWSSSCIDWLCCWNMCGDYRTENNLVDLIIMYCYTLHRKYHSLYFLYV